MTGSLQHDGPEAKKRTVGAARIALSLLAAFMMLLCLGWLIDFYVAATAEERFKLALSRGDFATACINASIAADAYDMARDQDALQKWRDAKAGVCRP